MLKEEELRRADVVTSCILVVMGLGVIGAALGMPMEGRHGGREITWYVSPALFPMILGFLLIACAVGVLSRAVVRGGHRGLLHEIGRRLKGLPRSVAARRMLLVWGLLGGYILLLSLHLFSALGSVLEGLSEVPFFGFLSRSDGEGINYVCSSFIFLSAFMLIFVPPPTGAPRWRRITLIAGLSLAIPWIVGYLLKEQLATSLPWLAW